MAYIIAIIILIELAASSDALKTPQTNTAANTPPSSTTTNPNSLNVTIVKPIAKPIANNNKNNNNNDDIIKQKKKKKKKKKNKKKKSPQKRSKLPPTFNQRLASEYSSLLSSHLIISYPTSHLLSPLTRTLLTWQFTFTGPQSSPYSRGVYTGRIKFPPNYPLSPPSIYMLTPNGRWGVKEKICLSVTDFHEESWDFRWNLRTIIEGLRGHMCVDGEGE
eukprot:CAMPEP_0182493714 /NCGR_PEP_ID=MMETSP1321-20130603/2631_1 /TAXON_ID=91990 /ORGANISM="Bolidomonas sp., Strain RCC1657" /LENGTH=218 /DNA_ID=CAMNT_0024696553 /DNA_START=358 /DNA_END=1011 /DNA_ORIENTATION=-